MVRVFGQLPTSPRRLSMVALAFDVVAIGSVFVAAAIGNAGSDRANSVASGIDLVVPLTASLLGLLLAVRAGGRPRGWKEPLAVAATLVSALFLFMAGLLWIAVVQGGD